jgi:hypothetical protein
MEGAERVNALPLSVLKAATAVGFRDKRSGFREVRLSCRFLKRFARRRFGIRRDSLYLALYPTGIGLRFIVPPHGQFGQLQLALFLLETTYKVSVSKKASIY